MSPLVRLNSDFEGKPLTTLRWKGRPAWVCRQLGAALGYANAGKRLVSKIGGDWSPEFIEGLDYFLVEGDELGVFKELAKDSPVALSSRVNRKLLVLFESGVHLVLAKTTKPIGRRLRRFLVDQVLPQLARDGRYDPDRVSSAGQTVWLSVAPPTVLGDPRLAREQRLARKLEFDDRRFRVATLLRTLDVLTALGRLAADVRADYEVWACELAVGHPLPRLRGAVEEAGVEIAALSAGTS